MVKIERTPTPPKSLEEERKKAHGSYREFDVMEQLRHDFHGKCYLCELGDVTDVQVEHLLPHHNRTIIERVFDWNNLFYSCTHCNSVKNNRKYDDKILDCCKVDPELVLRQIYSDGEVSVQPIADDSDETVKLTADLIQSCFNQRNTGIRTIEAEERVRRLAKTMNNLYKTLENYQKNKNSRKYTGALKAMLKREYKFAAFTRQYVRDHLNDYPGLAAFVS